MASLTPEERAEVEAFIKDDMAVRSRHDAQRDELRARLERMTPAQKEAVRSGRAKMRDSRPFPPRAPKHHYKGHEPQEWHRGRGHM